MKLLKYLAIGFLVIALVLIRFYESTLFNDPLISFFKSNYTQLEEAPDFETSSLILNTFLRYLLNSTISLLILFLLFPKKAIIRFASAFYTVLGVLLLGAFWYLISPMEQSEYFLVFYVRRFLIQPLFLLILLPAFYYQQYRKKNPA